MASALLRDPCTYVTSRDGRGKGIVTSGVRSSKKRGPCAQVANNICQVFPHGVLPTWRSGLEPRLVVGVVRGCGHRLSGINRAKAAHRVFSLFCDTKRILSPSTVLLPCTMASVVETGPQGTIYKCPDSVKVPEEDLLTFLFGEFRHA